MRLIGNQVVQRNNLNWLRFFESVRDLSAS